MPSRDGGRPVRGVGRSRVDIGCVGFFVGACAVAAKRQSRRRATSSRISAGASSGQLDHDSRTVCRLASSRSRCLSKFDDRSSRASTRACRVDVSSRSCANSSISVSRDLAQGQLQRIPLQHRPGTVLLRVTNPMLATNTCGGRVARGGSPRRARSGRLVRWEIPRRSPAWCCWRPWSGCSRCCPIGSANGFTFRRRRCSWSPRRSRSGCSRA